MRCPAAGPAPTVSCILKPRSGTVGLGMPILPPTTNVPDVPPRICTNKESVFFGPEHGLKYAQKVPYKTPEWRKLYHSPRNTIEGLNGLLKNDATAAFASPGRRRVRGRTAQTIFVALMLAAINISKIRSFLRGQASHDNPDKKSATARPINRRPQAKAHTVGLRAAPNRRFGVLRRATLLNLAPCRPAISAGRQSALRTGTIQPPNECKFQSSAAHTRPNVQFRRVSYCARRPLQVPQTWSRQFRKQPVAVAPPPGLEPGCT